MQHDTVTLTSAAHPFCAGSTTVPVCEGMTIAEMLQQAQPDPMLAAHAVAFIDGHMIHRRYWHCVRPRAGKIVEIRVLPMGGGGGGDKDPLRTVLQLAVLIAAAVVPGLATLGLTAVQQGFLQAGIAVLGNLAVNALVPVEGPDKLPADDEIFSIEGFRNRARPFQPVPQILGRRRVAPDFGARSFTEIVGRDQYIRALFVWGIGPLYIDESTLKIGETPITDFEDVEMEHRAGLPGDAARTLFSDTVIELPGLQVLLGDNTSTPTTGAQTRTAPADADELSVDITFPGGLYGTGAKTGDQFPVGVSLTILYREVGASTWLVPSFTAKTFPDSWIASAGQVNFEGARASAVRHGMRWSVSNGEYEVKIERLNTNASDNRIVDATYWTALRAIEDRDPIRAGTPVATTTVRIRASDQLNGSLDEFNGVVTTLGKDWHGADNSSVTWDSGADTYTHTVYLEDQSTVTWDSGADTYVHTIFGVSLVDGSTGWVDGQQITNPASLFRHVAQGSANAIPLADDALDLTSLQDFHDFCDTKGFECGLVVRNGRSVWEVMAQVAATGRAAPAYIAQGGWGVVIDRPQSVPVSHITPRNSARFEAEKGFTELPHAFRIPFVNEDESWRQDERRVYRTGFDDTNATRFEELRLPGITNPDQIEQMGRYRMAQAIHQPERWTFRQDMEFLTYQRGDRVKITHDVLLVGLHSGRVKSVTVDGSNNVTALALDEQVEMESGKDYGISIRTVDDAAVTRQVVTAAGATNAITLATSIPAVGGSPAIQRDDLFGFGILGSETDDAQIIAIRPNSHADASITAVPYREAVYAGDDEPIPAFVTNLTPIPALPAPLVRDVISDERMLALGNDGSLRVRIGFNVDPVPQIASFAGSGLQIQQRRTGTGEPYVSSPVDQQDGGTVITSSVRERETYDFRFRWVPQGGRLPGPWSLVSAHTVIGRSTPPAGLEGLTLSAFGGAAYLRWDRPDEIDVRFGGQVQFRHSPVTSGATWGASNSIGDLAQASAQLVVLPLKPGTYLARVIDQGGRTSLNTATVTTKQATVLAFTSTDTIDEATAFSGTKTDVTVVGSTLQLTDPAASQTGTYYFAAGLDLGSVVRRRLTSRVALSSFNIFDTIAARTELISTWPSFVGDVPDGGDAIIQVRHTDDEPPAGTEFLTNGTFDSDLSGWTTEGATDWSWSSGKAAYSGSGLSGSLLRQDFTRIGAKTYSFTVASYSGGASAFRLQLQDTTLTNSNIDAESVGADGTYTGTVPDGYDRVVFFNVSAAALSLTLDDVSVTEPAVDWSSWDRLDSSEFDARAFEYRALVSTTSPDINVSVSEIGIDVDRL